MSFINFGGNEDEESDDSYYNRKRLEAKIDDLEEKVKHLQHEIGHLEQYKTWAEEHGYKE